MPVVEGGHIIEIGFEHRLEEQLDPLGRDAPQVRIDDGAGLHVQRLGDLEDRPESAAFARDAAVGRHDLERRLDAVMEQDGLKVLDRRVPDDVHGAVHRAAVGIHDDGLLAGKIFGQARLHGPDDMPDGARIIVARNADQDIGCLDRLQLVLDFFSENDRFHEKQHPFMTRTPLRRDSEQPHEALKILSGMYLIS